jgi:hypothetical protein
VITQVPKKQEPRHLAEIQRAGMTIKELKTYKASRIPKKCNAAH